MSAQILNGKALAATIRDDLAKRVIALKTNGITPGLGTVLVGSDPGSLSYVGGKHRDCNEVGIHSIRVDLPESASEKDVLAAISDLNLAKECTGYIVQLPLPKGIKMAKSIMQKALQKPICNNTVWHKSLLDKRCFISQTAKKC